MFTLSLALRLTITFLVLWALGCSKRAASDESAADNAAPVQVEAAKRDTIHNLITVEAVLFPLQQATIVPKISAPVAKFLVQRGAHVKQGQLLAVLEDKDLAAAAQESRQLYEQAQAAYQTTVAATMPDDLTKATTDVQTAQEALEAAQKVFDSRERLFKQGAISQRLVDDARVALVQAHSQFETAVQHLRSVKTVGSKEQTRGAKAQMDAAQAHYQASEAQVSYAEVRSPIDGVVSDRPINIGEMASSGAALLSVVNIARVTARANVPLDQAALINTGRLATISGPGVTLKGKVTVVSPTVDPNTTTVQVWVEASNPGEHLKLGTTVEISIDGGAIPNAIVVPASALLSSDEGGEKVMVAGADGLAHERPVKVGIHSGDDVQILEGLKEGEKVITQGALGLDDKAKIQIAEPGKEGDADDKNEAGEKKQDDKGAGANKADEDKK